MKRVHKESCRKYKYFISTLWVMLFTVLSFQAHAGGTVIVIGGSNYDNHHFSGHGNSHRLRNKHYFDSRYRKSYSNRYYGNRFYRNNYRGNSYGYNNRNYYRNNRSYCPN